MNERSFICQDKCDQDMNQISSAVPHKRIESKARNRQALIDATFDVVAEYGIAGVSFTRVLEKANLSRGMINLHFESKEQLLLEAAKMMAEKYYTHLQSFVNNAEEDPESQLIALLEADFDDALLNPREIGIWFAFRGEARYNEQFKSYSDTRDAHLLQQYDGIFEQLLADGSNPSIKRRDLTLGLLALTEGLWSDYFMHGEGFDRGQAKRVIYLYLSRMLPHCGGLGAMV
jgi:TetR/AcrR family transcriptional repressor of bet genes